MTYDAVIIDSHVILPQGMVEKNILIDEGKIVGFTNDVPACDNKINGHGLVSIPGPIDTHTHYGVYSPINEAAKTESHAAAIGGITTMMRMLRLGDPFSNSLQSQLDVSSQNHYIDYAIHASIFTPQQINEMNLCVEKGITSFKIYMNLGGEVGHVYMDMPPNSSNLVAAKVDVTDELVKQTVKAAAELGCPVLVHAEDYESCGCGIKTAKEKNQDGLSAWSSSRSPEFEAKAIKTVSKFVADFPFEEAIPNVKTHVIDGRGVRQWKHIDTFDPLLATVLELLHDRYASDEAVDDDIDVSVQQRCRHIALAHPHEQATCLHVGRPRVLFLGHTGLREEQSSEHYGQRDGPHGCSHCWSPGHVQAIATSQCAVAWTPTWQYTDVMWQIVPRTRGAHRA